MKASPLRRGKAAPTGKVSAALFPQAQRLKASKPSLEPARIQTVATTQLENLVCAYERATGNEFERSAILKGIAAELAERTTEKGELRKVS